MLQLRVQVSLRFLDHNGGVKQLREERIFDCVCLAFRRHDLFCPAPRASRSDCYCVRWIARGSRCGTGNRVTARYRSEGDGNMKQVGVPQADTSRR
jgi:hypothetical protein